MHIALHWIVNGFFLLFSLVRLAGRATRCTRLVAVGAGVERGEEGVGQGEGVAAAIYGK